MCNVEFQEAWARQQRAEDVGGRGRVWGTRLSMSHADLSSCPNPTLALVPGWVQQPPHRRPSAWGCSADRIGPPWGSAGSGDEKLRGLFLLPLSRL